jgi:NCS2 family nucleobase:cation symporter-2
MKKPPNVLYGVGDRMPPGVLMLCGLQHVGLMSMFLLYPVLIAKACDASPEVAGSLVSLTLIAMAAGTILQVIPIGPFGSGYLCQPIPSIVYLVPSLIAARYGGLPLVFGMTIAAGAFELLLSRAMRRLRPIFPPEIVGLVILLVGIATGLVGLRVALGEGKAASAEPIELCVGLGTLALMIALNVWGGARLRIFCMLIGMGTGYVVSVLLGTFSSTDADAIAHAHMVDIPALSHLGWSFDAALALPFGVAAIAATLKVMGNVTTSQKANDADWVRADMKKVSRGVLADGLGTAFAGVIGARGSTARPPSWASRAHRVCSAATWLIRSPRSSCCSRSCRRWARFST